MKIEKWKYIYLLFLIGLLIFLVFLKKQNPFQQEIDTKEPEQPVSVEVTTNTGVKQVTMDDYLVGVVAGEMPASFDIEAIKAQVVVSRTYVYAHYLQVDNTTNTQVYLDQEARMKKWGEDYSVYEKKIREAVELTNEEVIVYNGECITALFFASSNGYTQNCNDYFSGDEPYLQSVSSPYDEFVDPNYLKEQFVSNQELHKIFETEVKTITILSYNTSKRVEKVKVNDAIYTGREMREKLGLASDSFTYKKVNDGYEFTTKGNGHGVGMSQYGAQGMALESKKYNEIINHYYKGVKIINK